MTRKTAEIVSVVLAELEAQYAAEAASAVAGCLAQENLGLNLETPSDKELDSLVHSIDYSEDASKELAASTDCLLSSVLESGWPKNPSPILDVGYQPHLGPGAAL